MINNMTDQKKDPQLNLYNGVPVVIKLKKFATEGQNKYGKWFLWKLIKEGIEYTFFANEETHLKFFEKGEGATIQITKEGNDLLVAEADNNARAGEREFLFNDKQNALCIMTQAIFKTTYRLNESVQSQLKESYEDAKYLRDLILNDDE